VRFGQPGVFGCTLVCQNIDNDKVIQTAPIRIADIEVIVRSNFFMWLFAIAISITAIIFSAVY
jgi:hypothetical protein